MTYGELILNDKISRIRFGLVWGSMWQSHSHAESAVAFNTLRSGWGLTHSTSSAAVSLERCHRGMPSFTTTTSTAVLLCSTGEWWELVSHSGLRVFGVNSWFVFYDQWYGWLSESLAELQKTWHGWVWLLQSVLYDISRLINKHSLGIKMHKFILVCSTEL